MGYSSRQQSVVFRWGRYCWGRIAIAIALILAFFAYHWLQNIREYQIEQPLVRKIQAAGGKLQFRVPRRVFPYALPLPVFFRVNGVQFIDCKIPGEVFPVLASLNHLEHLDFYNSKIGDSRFGDAELKLMAGLKSLRSINVVLSQVTDDGLKELESMDRLESLALSSTKITDAGLRHLLRLKKLSRLQLAQTAVSDEGLKTISSLHSLSLLDLYGTRITDQGLKSLELLRKLEYLDLGGTAISNAGLAHLGVLPNLVTVGVRGTQIGDSGLEQLTSISSLRYLYLNMAQTTKEGRADFRRALPKCEVDPNP
ncbi:leucine-rich repeat domain-containing protein [Schlesneria paludicola]|uniref:hypothetical protein n=1 Tax=Schlesneria paludicola TaxID=360056 RepID=UPI00029A7282|nr:hypothetical protein [Schlesneria paludicola]